MGLSRDRPAGSKFGKYLSQEREGHDGSGQRLLYRNASGECGFLYVFTDLPPLPSMLLGQFLRLQLTRHAGEDHEIGVHAFTRDLAS